MIALKIIGTIVTGLFLVGAVKHAPDKADAALDAVGIAIIVVAIWV